MNRTDVEILSSLSVFRDADDSCVTVFYGSPWINGDGVIKALVRDRSCIYYDAACVSDREQRKRLAMTPALRAHLFNDVPSYEEIFFSIVSSVKPGERLILVFRNFERFFYEGGFFLEELMGTVRAPENAGKLSVFLISDDEVWVENSFVARAGDCAAEISGFVKKRESHFFEFRDFFPDLSLKDAISVYSVFGGETALWRYYDAETSIKDNIIRLFISDKAPLRNMVHERLTGIVREPAVYMTILANLASGDEKLNDLFHATGFPRAKLSVYLKTLMEPQFVEKVFSYGSVGTSKTRKGVYRISNLFLQFYFRAIYPSEHFFFGTDPGSVYDMYVAQALTDVCDTAFKRICLEYIEKLDADGRLPFIISDRGEWDGKAGTIDIVAQGENGETLLGICSYRNVMTEEDYHFTVEYAKQAGFTADHVYMFSGQGFDEGLSAAARVMNTLHLIGLKEIENG